MLTELRTLLALGGIDIGLFARHLGLDDARDVFFDRRSWFGDRPLAAADPAALNELLPALFGVDFAKSCEPFVALGDHPSSLVIGKLAGAIRK
jgi:hypothetical protein